MARRKDHVHPHEANSRLVYYCTPSGMMIVCYRPAGGGGRKAPEVSSVIRIPNANKNHLKIVTFLENLDWMQKSPASLEHWLMNNRIAHRRDALVPWTPPKGTQSKRKRTNPAVADVKVAGERL